MPHKDEGHDQIEIIPLHPTFAAEVRGVDFSQDVSPEVFGQIKEAIAKVSAASSPLLLGGADC